MLWCKNINMWCEDMDEEDKAFCCCDGCCRSCEDSERIEYGEVVEK